MSALGSKSKTLAWAAAAAAALAGAAALPRLAGLVPWSVERRVAELAGAVPGLSVCGARQPESAALLQRVAERLYPVYTADGEFPLTVEAASGPAVNAFAALGGRVYVYDGLLQRAESAEELAGALAHEIEHVRRRHVLRGAFLRLATVEAPRLALGGGGTMSPRLAERLMSMGFSREQEEEADEGGLRRLRDARVDSAGFQRFFERLERLPERPAILAGHPPSGSRAARARLYGGGPSDPLMSRADWERLKRICR